MQSKLRAALRESFPDAVAERRSPTCNEIVNVTCHYRDAVIEEVLRCSNTESGAVRRTLCDARVLGHIIPKGVDVFLMGNGPSQFSPAFPIDDSKRTKSYFETKDHVSAWDKEGMQFFNPERWLVKQPNGERIFDQNAGPLLVFGLGEVCVITSLLIPPSQGADIYLTARLHRKEDGEFSMKRFFPN